MNQYNKRLDRIEKNATLNQEQGEPWFIEWFGNPWMPEEQEEVLAKHPGCEVYQKSMMPDPPYYREKNGPDRRTLNNSRYGARMMSDYERKYRQKNPETKDPEEEKYRAIRIQDLRDFMNEAKGLPPRPDKEPVEPLFEDYGENPWTEEEKAEVLAKHPDCDYFHKQSEGYGSRKSDEPQPQTHTGDFYGAVKRVPWASYGKEDARRKGYTRALGN